MNFYKCFLLMPLFLLFIAIPIEKYNIDFSRAIKFLAILIIVLNAIFLKQRNIFVLLLVLTVVYLCFLTYYNNINIKQAGEDGIRYLIPILALIYGLQLKDVKTKAITIIIVYVLLNDFYQLISGIYTMLNEKQLVFKRATGFVGFFDFFGFINLVALVVINETILPRFENFKLHLKVVFTFFILWSLSLKIVILFMVYAIIKNRKLLLIPAGLIVFLMLVKNTTITNAILLRVDRYLVHQDSARNESYRLMYNNINDFWLFGKGPGTFGGPASTKYESFLYKKYKFNWFGEYGMATTDTYYPHLIVELGMVFGLFYLIIVLIMPIYISPNKLLSLSVILILSLNSVFSFALNSMSYCFFSLLLIFLVENKHLVKDTKE
ncbi:hypothetical protein BFR04_05710 [Gaetbulibacter sp. 4G1]|nr:hypothetical protein [Gaetbulibacter sp. 4G1]PIA79017.1 hypothetical protein BFR04_05710 [Gaetbulibacter sp. 4G1]